MRSLIYSNINVYRVLMNLLYGFKYTQRFESIISLLPTKTEAVCELCFGDIYIATHCRNNNIKWSGIDINPQFCQFASKSGFDALCDNIITANFPVADVYIMSGSLYHFYKKSSILFDKIFKHCNHMIISEPVINWSSEKGMVGSLARLFSNPGIDYDGFRFSMESLNDCLELYCHKNSLNYQVESAGRDALILISK
ncbi:MAG: hypothetical protein ACKVHQ_07145 [Gammaproteobacteria bacterium]|jgi:hypothetical protein